MLPELLDTYRQLRNEITAKNLIENERDKRADELATSNALIESNRSERTGQNLLKLDPERAIAAYEEGLTHVLNRWNDIPGHTDLGHAIMRLYQLQAEAYEILGNYEQAGRCHREGIEIGLVVLRGNAMAEPPRAMGGDEPATWSRWLDNLSDRIASSSSTLPSMADGIGQWDVVQLAASSTSVIYQQREALAVTAGVESPDEAVAVRLVADAYSNLARVEWALGHGSESLQCLIRGLAIEALMPGIESGLPDVDRPPIQDSPRKNDNPGEAVAAESHR
jgi:hypothetical protein